MRTKQYEGDLQIDAGSREIIACISTDSVDRDGEVVLPTGLQKKQYAGNPIVLYGHDSTSLPIGTTRWIKADKNKLIAKYYISDKTQLGRDVFALMQDGVLRAHSIGFLEQESGPPTTKELQLRPDWKDCRRVIRSYELLEFSVVPIPCNPEALSMAIAKCAPETREFLGKAFEPKPECWEWEEGINFVNRETGGSVDEIPVGNKDVERPVEKTFEIPTPKYCRSWKSVEASLAKLIEDRSAEEILARLQGKA